MAIGIITFSESFGATLFSILGKNKMSSYSQSSIKTLLGQGEDFCPCLATDNSFGICQPKYLHTGTTIINPENIGVKEDGYFDDPALLRMVPIFFFGLGVVSFIFLVPISLFIAMPPSANKGMSQQPSKQPIKALYFGHVIGYQPIRNSSS